MVVLNHDKHTDNCDPSFEQTVDGISYDWRHETIDGYPVRELSDQIEWCNSSRNFWQELGCVIYHLLWYKRWISTHREALSFFYREKSRLEETNESHDSHHFEMLDETLQESPRTACVLQIIERVLPGADLDEQAIQGSFPCIYALCIRTGGQIDLFRHVKGESVKVAITGIEGLAPLVADAHANQELIIRKLIRYESRRQFTAQDEVVEPVQNSMSYQLVVDGCVSTVKAAGHRTLEFFSGKREEECGNDKLVPHGLFSSQSGEWLQFYNFCACYGWLLTYVRDHFLAALDQLPVLPSILELGPFDELPTDLSLACSYARKGKLYCNTLFRSVEDSHKDALEPLADWLDELTSEPWTSRGRVSHLNKGLVYEWNFFHQLNLDNPFINLRKGVETIECLNRLFLSSDAFLKHAFQGFTLRNHSDKARGRSGPGLTSYVTDLKDTFHKKCYGDIFPPEDYFDWKIIQVFADCQRRETAIQEADSLLEPYQKKGKVHEAKELKKLKRYYLETIKEIAGETGLHFKGVAYLMMHTTDPRKGQANVLEIDVSVILTMIDIACADVKKMTSITENETINEVSQRVCTLKTELVEMKQREAHLMPYVGTGVCGVWQCAFESLMGTVSRNVKKADSSIDFCDKTIADLRVQVKEERERAAGAIIVNFSRSYGSYNSFLKLFEGDDESLIPKHFAVSALEMLPHIFSRFIYTAIVCKKLDEENVVIIKQTLQRFQDDNCLELFEAEEKRIAALLALLVTVDILSGCAQPDSELVIQILNVLVNHYETGSELTKKHLLSAFKECVVIKKIREQQDSVDSNDDCASIEVIQKIESLINPPPLPLKKANSGRHLSGFFSRNLTTTAESTAILPHDSMHA